jgi:excinuclease ABC subunit B
MTDSMARTISETERRRKMQIEYNEAHGMVPTALNKSKDKILQSTKVADGDPQLRAQQAEYSQYESSIAAEPQAKYYTEEELEKAIVEKRKAMEKAAKALDFIEAARLRDELFELQAKKK